MMKVNYQNLPTKVKINLKLVFLGLFCLLCVSYNYQPQENVDFDQLAERVSVRFVHYQFQIKTKQRTNRAEITARAWLNIITPTTRSFHFRLANSYVTKLHILTVNGMPVKYQRQGDVYLVNLPRLYQAGEKLELGLKYQLQSKNFTKHVQMELSGNWYPRNFLPESVTADFKIMVSPEQMAIANGNLIKKTFKGNWKIYQWKLKQPLSMLGVTIGNYRMQSYHSSGTSYQIFVTPNVKTEMMQQLKNWAVVINEYYLKSFGGKRYGELAIILNDTTGEDKSFGSMIFLHRFVKSHSLLYRLSHEMAHYWWGNLIIPKTQRDWWLAEGFANYSALLIAELDLDKVNSLEKNLTASKVLAKWRSEYQQTLTNLNKCQMPEMSLAEIGPFDMQRELLYSKGAFVLYMIRSVIGEANFEQYLKEFVQNYQYHGAGVRDFTSLGGELFGAHVVDFFRQWVYSVGFYNLALGEIQITPMNGRYLVSVEVENIGQLSLPEQIDLTIVTPQKTFVEVLSFQGVGVTIQKILPEKPKRIAVNGNNVIIEPFLNDNTWINEE